MIEKNGAVETSEFPSKLAEVEFSRLPVDWDTSEMASPDASVEISLSPDIKGRMRVPAGNTKEMISALTHLGLTAVPVIGSIELIKVCQAAGMPWGCGFGLAAMMLLPPVAVLCTRLKRASA
ncbi:hypothetical protein AB0E96_37675 [Kitasatospora sp. NPDC036755]|uniref:hypothetical protein n=1 Tax=Kitasatospora sp. NPDC036755 TaxID=3154600 RepID=UPI0033C4FAFE